MATETVAGVGSTGSVERMELVLALIPMIWLIGIVIVVTGAARKRQRR